MDSPEALLKEIEKRRVLVIGDTIIDVNTYAVPAKDLDDGTPVYRKVSQAHGVLDRFTLGGAALVVRNLLELGATVDFITARGHGAGSDVSANFRHKGLSVHALQSERPQTVKTRLWCRGKKVLQLDQASNAPLADLEEGWLIDKFDEVMERRTNPPEVIVVADYRHGLISENFAIRIVERFPHSPPVVVSSQVAQSDTNHHWYKGAPVFVLNKGEAEAVLARGDEYDADYIEALREKLVTSSLVVTMGADGCMSTDELGGGRRHFPAESIKEAVVDPCGAGDAFLAALSVTGIAGFANLWAGLSCCVPGANPPSREMLKRYASGFQGYILGSDRDDTVPPGGHETHHDERGDALFS